MKKFDLQMFAESETSTPAKPVSGKKLIYLFRILNKAAEKAAVAMAFTTENERSKSKDADSVATKDGSVRVPGTSETEITATALLANGDSLADDLEEAMDKDELIEIWEANLEEPGATEGTFKGRYFQGYLTEFTLTSNAEDHVEYETTFAINGSGAKGDVTVSAAQQEVAAYVFKDTEATGA